MDDEQAIPTLLDVFLSRDVHNMLQMRIAQNEKNRKPLDFFGRILFCSLSVTANMETGQLC